MSRRHLFLHWEGTKPVLGVVHLLPLPGAPGYRGETHSIAAAALRDASALLEGGVHGLIVENLGDAPFFPGRVPVHTIAHLTAIAVELRRRFDVPLGVNVLRNDGVGAMAVAAAAGADFIRVNVLCGARVADQGLLEGNAHDVLRERSLLGAARVRILADVAVKHSAPLAPLDPAQEALDTVERGGADGLIVTGSATGSPVDVDLLERVAAVSPVAVFVGSGVQPETVETLARYADGFIVGTAFKEGGDIRRPVDPARVRKLLERLK